LGLGRRVVDPGVGRTPARAAGDRHGSGGLVGTQQVLRHGVGAAADRVRRRVAWWCHVAIPIAVLCGYQWATWHLYGRGLLSDALLYAKTLAGSGGTI